jgi:hypothetical protein
MKNSYALADAVRGMRKAYVRYCRACRSGIAADIASARTKLERAQAEQGRVHAALARKFPKEFS